MLSRLSKITKYIRVFGLLHGVRLWAAVELHRRQEDKSVIRKLAVPGYPSPICLRDTLADHAIFWQCLVMEQYDFFVFPQAKRLVSVYEDTLSRGERPLIIDLGGNIGLATVWLSRKFPKAQIYVVEPDSNNFELLEQNTASLGNQVTRLQGGIWDRPTSLEIVNPQSGAAALIVKEKDVAGFHDIRAYTVEEICLLADIKKPLIVKIDIEGAQSALFRSNTSWVANTHLISLELDDWLFPWGGTSQNFFSAVSKHPFDYLMRDESIFCFRNFDDSPE